MEIQFETKSWCPVDLNLQEIAHTLVEKVWKSKINQALHEHLFCGVFLSLLFRSSTLENYFYTQSIAILTIIFIFLLKKTCPIYGFYAKDTQLNKKITNYLLNISINSAIYLFLSVRSINLMVYSDTTILSS